MNWRVELVFRHELLIASLPFCVKKTRLKELTVKDSGIGRSYHYTGFGIIILIAGVTTLILIVKIKQNQL